MFHVGDPTDWLDAYKAARKAGESATKAAEIAGYVLQARMAA
jgi:hypothetical protein